MPFWFSGKEFMLLTPPEITTVCIDLAYNSKLVSDCGQVLIMPNIKHPFLCITCNNSLVTNMNMGR